MIVVAIDPGPARSAWVVYECGRVISHGKESNEDLKRRIYQGAWGDGWHTHGVDYVFEQIASYGMPVGADIFETVFWTGRLFEQANEMLHRDRRIERLPRREVKLHLCGSSKAKDSNIRQALIDRFGGSRGAAIGIKSARGPLYGIKADEWQALALAVTWSDKHVAAQLPQASGA